MYSCFASSLVVVVVSLMAIVLVVAMVAVATKNSKKEINRDMMVLVLLLKSLYARKVSPKSVTSDFSTPSQF